MLRLPAAICVAALSAGLVGCGDPMQARLNPAIANASQEFTARYSQDGTLAMAPKLVKYDLAARAEDYVKPKDEPYHRFCNAQVSWGFVSKFDKKLTSYHLLLVAKPPEWHYQGLIVEGEGEPIYCDASAFKKNALETAGLKHLLDICNIDEAIRIEEDLRKQMDERRAAREARDLKDAKEKYKAKEAAREKEARDKEARKAARAPK